MSRIACKAFGPQGGHGQDWCGMMDTVGVNHGDAGSAVRATSIRSARVRAKPFAGKIQGSSHRAAQDFAAQRASVPAQALGGLWAPPGGGTPSWL